MKNEERTKKVTFALEWLSFCGKCLDTLKEEIETDAKAQDDNTWYPYNSIGNHTRYANDLAYIRRQLLKLEKELRGW